MDFLFPILSAVFQGASVTLDKVILSMRRFNYQLYLAGGFPIYFLATLVIFLLFGQPPRVQDFEGTYGLLLAGVILITTVTNLLYYRAVEDDGLGEIEMAELLKDIPTVLFAGILFVDERMPVVLVAAAVATLAMAWSHWDHHRFRMRRRTAHFLFWMLLTQPLLAAAAKHLLVVWHPVSFEFVRTAGATLLLVPWFCRGVSRRFPKGVIGYLILTNVLSAIGWMLYFTSYKASGVVYTVLIFTLQPFLVYMVSMLFLKERFRWKRFVGFVIVLLCVGVVQLVHGG